MSTQFRVDIFQNDHISTTRSGGFICYMSKQSNWLVCLLSPTLRQV
ncbi:MAG: hypothetical protein WCS79_12430 [Paludibacter sp.]